MNDNLMQAVDAISASSAIRLRYQMLAAKGRRAAVVFPPAIEHLPEHQMLPPTDYAAHLAAHGHSLAPLVQLRQEAANQIERLIAFLDATEGGFEDVLDGDEDAAVDDDGCDEDFDKEPSLGSLGSSAGDQTAWAVGAADDLEDSGLGNSDREDDGLHGDEADSSDDEPSLGWTVDGVAGSRSGDDLELQDHNPTNVKKDRARRSQGKRKVRTIGLELNVVGAKRVNHLTKRQYALIERRLDDASAFRPPTPNTRGLR